MFEQMRGNLFVLSWVVQHSGLICFYECGKECSGAPRSHLVLWYLLKTQLLENFT